MQEPLTDEEKKLIQKGTVSDKVRVFKYGNDDRPVFTLRAVQRIETYEPIACATGTLMLENGECAFCTSFLLFLTLSSLSSFSSALRLCLCFCGCVCWLGAACVGLDV